MAESLQSMVSPILPRLTYRTSSADAPQPQINYIPPPPGPPLADVGGAESAVLGDETNASTLAVEYLAAGSSIRCALLHVKYGKYNGEAAGLIIFETNFDFPAQDSRTRRAAIEVSFSLKEPEKATPLPKILHHSPLLAQSLTPTSVSVRRTGDAKLSGHTPSPADVVELEVGRSKEESFTRDYYSKITSRAMPHSDTRKGRQCINTVLWRISENEAQKSGVPPIFRGAIVVQLPDGDKFDGLFYAQFKLHSTQACRLRQMQKSFTQYFGRDKNGPVRFDSRVNLQADGLSDSLEDIDLDQLLALPKIQRLPDGY